MDLTDAPSTVIKKKTKAVGKAQTKKGLQLKRRG
jgi:hypothetical protein